MNSVSEMMSNVLFSLLLVTPKLHGFILDSSVDQFITVNSSVGTIVGTSESVTFANISGNVYKFFGIPYAESTDGLNRFTKPVKKARFTRPFNATSYGPTCTRSEDCLSLNIFVPADTRFGVNLSSRNMSVMAFIHGGGFLFGSGGEYPGYHLALVGGVIVVTLNYRLGAFGFLSTNDSNAPGNIGLWDQRLALQWISQNIRAFGGDPTQVTLFGESAGAASTLHQALYPGNKGLFQRIITESVPTDTEDYPKEKAMKLAGLVNCNNTDTSKMMDCLRKAPTGAIYNAMRAPGLSLPHRPWVPIVDGDFIAAPPENHVNFASIQDEKSKEFFSSLDCLGGINSYEGLLQIPMFMGELGMHDINTFAINQTTFEKAFIPMNLQSLYGFDRYFPEKLKEVVAFAYTDWSDVTNDAKRRLNLVQLSSDYKFFLPTSEPIKTHSALANKSKSYLYEFAARTPIRKPFRSLPTWLDGPGVANHGDELSFVFGFVGETSIPGHDLKLSLAIMTMWSNFAKTG